MPDGPAPAFSQHAVSRIAARRVSFDWPWAREEAAFVAGNWARRRALLAGLFDGPVFLACGWRLEGGTFAADLFETRYAAFIGHRDAGSPDGGVRNVFSAIVPRGSDGGILLGVMGDHTANAGQAYFPCGTPDRDDLGPDGSVDLAGSAARELMEETGLSVSARAVEEWRLVAGDGQLALFGAVAFPETAPALAAAMERHRRAEAEPELAGFRIASGPGDIDPARMPPVVRAYLAHAFTR